MCLYACLSLRTDQESNQCADRHGLLARQSHVQRARGRHVVWYGIDLLIMIIVLSI